MSYTKIRPKFPYDYRYDTPTFDYGAPSNISHPPHIKDPPITYSLQTNLIHIRSDARDITAWPNPGDFAIEGLGFHDIYAIELMSASIPNLDNIQLDQFNYIKLNDPALDHIDSSGLQKVFAVVTYLSHLTNAPYLSVDCRGNPVTFFPVKARLDRLHITITHPDGTVANIGSESGTFNPALQVSMMFKITTRVKRREGIDRDAVVFSNSLPAYGQI